MEWKDVVYGPVKSRRLGQSLGINLTPLELKVCNFSCGYCRVGVASKGKLKQEDYKNMSWTPKNIKESISRGLECHAQNATPIDYVTIAGNGEASLYPWFADIVDYFLQEKSKCLPNKPTSIFSNSTKVGEHIVREAIYKLDRRFFKLDAGNERTFRKINLPIGVTYSKIIKNLISFDNFELSIAVVNGGISNYDSFFNQEFLDIIKKMNFTRMFLYDIDIPKTTSPKFNRKIDRVKLEHLAQYFSKQLNREIDKDIIILWEPTTRESNLPLYPKQIN